MLVRCRNLHLHLAHPILSVILRPGPMPRIKNPLMNLPNIFIFSILLSTHAPFILLEILIYMLKHQIALSFSIYGHRIEQAGMGIVITDIHTCPRTDT